MARHALLFALLAALLLGGATCKFYSHKNLSFTAPVVVTKGGLDDPGRLVTFAANKIKAGGAEVAGSRLSGDQFTDFLGQADYHFGYNLEYDDEDDPGQFQEGARVVASVDYNGTLYTDTVHVQPPFTWPFNECTTETLRISLPASE